MSTRTGEHACGAAATRGDVYHPSFILSCLSHSPPPPTSRGGRRSETLIALYGVHDKESTLVQPITGKNTNPDEGGLSATSDT